LARVPRPQPIDGDDSAARRARYKARLWDEFNYYGLQDSLAERWAQLYGLVQAKSHSSRRLFASSSIGNGAHEGNHPPCCDHTTLWRCKARQPRFSEVLVTQPYSYDLDKMVAFAKEQGLWFWMISERPAWHFPRGVFFIEWARAESQFAAQRGTQETDLAMRTIHAWKGEELLPGPGTVFTLVHPVAIERWRDRFDVNSLMWAELTRMIQLHNDDVAGSAH
jgi:hypothetical protein